jgi:hypothetical protein
MQRVTFVPADAERMFPTPRRFYDYLAANWQQLPKNGPIWVPEEAVMPQFRIRLTAHGCLT